MCEEDVLYFVEVKGRVFVPEELYADWTLVEMAIEDLQRCCGKPVERISSGRFSSLVSDVLAAL